jgi:flagella basal body P-ring formation protein FlgA
MTTDVQNVQTESVIYVRYENLSERWEKAEIQKDILLQFLLEKYPQTVTFAELPLGEKSQASRRTLHVFCERCEFQGASPRYLTGSYQPRSGEKQGLGRFSFSVGGEKINPQTWQANIKEDKPCYFVAAARAFSAETIIKAQDLKIQDCSSEKNNLIPDSFLSEHEAQIALTSYLGKTTVRTFQEKERLSPGVTRMSFDVRANDFVRLQYKGTGGLLIRSRAKALANGVLGATVQVQLFTTSAGSSGINSNVNSKIIAAKVTGPGEVEYEN